MTESRPRSYVEGRVEVPRGQADAVCNYIIDNISSGLVLEDEEESQYTGIVFYVPPGRKPQWQEGLREYLTGIFNRTGNSLPPITERVIEEVEWVDQYRRSVKPIRICDDLVVRPPWHPAPAGIQYDIVTEPKMTSGTGSHETTRSCLKVIRELFRPGRRFLNVGCGSGVLSILAAKMGAAFVKAIDTDEVAVENCPENLALNGIDIPCDVQTGSIEKYRGDKPYDFICADIIRSTILNMLGDLVVLAADNGILVLSGLLEDDEREVSTRLVQENISSYSILKDNDWLTCTVHVS
ncbi:MAG: 50S ribosomal protein L11 methyltransferase [Candidatus Zixiibacteriota bacterium]